MESRRFGEEVPKIEEDGEREGVENGELIEWMRKDEIGMNQDMDGPFGRRKIIYCDYTASARALHSIEDYLRNEVLPFYGNTHSSVTITAEQTTLFMHEARQEIRAASGAGDLDDVIFTGSGATCAMELLVHLMSDTVDTVVVHSCQEHHSNLLPWRNMAKDCLKVEELDNGQVDLVDLERVLKGVRKEYNDVRIIGAFSACSNVTGVLVDVERVMKVLKSYNVISIWDYASAAPYIPISINGTHPIDAIFFSGHKFPGGVSSPGVLIVKKAIIKAKQPKRIGGGTVFFVNDNEEWYLKEAEQREEGGTADAIGAVRLAMAVKLKRSIGVGEIERRERLIVNHFITRLSTCSNIHLLGPKSFQHRLPIFSFLITNPATGLFYHHNYISALLNDLFGIQTRSGCMCTGPYAHKLLGIDEKLSNRFIEALKESGQLDRTHLRRHAEYSQREFLRPGFTRLSLPYFMELEMVDVVAKCLVAVAERAHEFMHLYQVNCETGEWHHKSQRVFHGRRWLGHAKFTKNGLVTKANKSSGDVKELAEILEEFQSFEAEIPEISKVPDARLAIEKEYLELRWFVLPIEILELKMGGARLPEALIKPRNYPILEEQTTVLPEPVTVPQRSMEEYEEEVTVCPLNPIKPRGIDGEVGKDEKEEEEVKETEDWNKRVIVRRREMSKEEEMRLEWHTPGLEMYKKVTEVVHQLKMIKDGDRVLVCLSGGKDSLSLLHILHFYQQRCRKARSTSFELGAITVDPGSTEYNPRPLIEYCRSLNIDYFYEEQDIIGAALKTPGLRSICAFCSRMKRGRLAAAAQLHGWNVLAMGQHLDDLAESFFIAAFQNGNLSTMKAQYATKDGALRVIRPLVFVREKALRQFAEEKKLPVVAENCPACFNQATERHRIKQLLAQQELVFPELFNSLRSALRPLLLVDSAHTSEMRSQAIANIVNS